MKLTLCSMPASMHRVKDIHITNIVQRQNAGWPAIVSFVEWVSSSQRLKMYQSYLISMQRGWRVRSFHCRAFLATGVQYALQFMKPDTPLQVSVYLGQSEINIMQAAKDAIGRAARAQWHLWLLALCD